jgi:hypothetical protein
MVLGDPTHGQSAGLPVDVYLDGKRNSGLLLEGSLLGGRVRFHRSVEPGSKVVFGFTQSRPHGDGKAVFFLSAVATSASLAEPQVADVRWGHAEAAQGKRELARFLENLLGIAPGRLDVHVSEKTNDASGLRSRLDFDRLTRQLARPNSGGSQALSGNQGGRAAVSERGALTILVSRGGLRAPTAIAALVTVGEQECRGKITFLGSHGLFVQVDLPDQNVLQSKPPVQVRFTILSEGIRSKVRCRCRLLALDDGVTTGTPGLDLAIERFSDGAGGKRLAEYIRDLHFRALSGT